jgi:hypothetical protein
MNFPTIILGILRRTTSRYFLTTYRWNPQLYADSLGPEVLAYRPGRGIKALSIFWRDSLNRPLSPKPIGVGRRP